MSYQHFRMAGEIRETDKLIEKLKYDCSNFETELPRVRRKICKNM